MGFAGGDANLYTFLSNRPTQGKGDVPYRDPTGRIHDPIPREVPPNWGEETIDEALAEVEQSIEARRQKGIEKGGLDRRHDKPLHKEKTWRDKLINRKTALQGGKKVAKKVVGPAFIAIDLFTGGPAYALNELTWPLSEAWRDDGFFDCDEKRDQPAPDPPSRPPHPGGGGPNDPIFIP